MDKIILGLLMLRGMTLYEIKTNIRKYLDSSCSTSAGSLHTAIRKLLDKNQISMEEKENKKVYYIEELGKEEFHKWVEQPMQTSKAKNIELSKFFFMGLANSNRRTALIKEYIKDLQKEYTKLQAIQEASKDINLSHMDDSLHDIWKYQNATLQYGLASTEFEINWYSKWLLENETN